MLSRKKERGRMEKEGKQELIKYGNIFRCKITDEQEKAILFGINHVY